MRLFSLNIFQGCISHLQTHMVVLLKYFSRVRLSPPDSCGCSPKKKSFQGCVSHLFLPYLVLSSSSPRVEKGSNSSKVLFSTFGSPSIFSLSLVRPLHVLEIEESTAKVLPTFGSPSIFSLSSVRPLHVLEMEELVAKSSFPLSDHPQSFLYHWSDLPLMVHFFPFLFFSLLIFSPSLNQLLYSHGDRKSDRKRFPSPLPITFHPLQFSFFPLPFLFSLMEHVGHMQNK